MRRIASRLTRSRRGHAAIEFALLTPWIFFLFLGVFDFGFFAYSLISVENAARVAVLYTSSGSGTATSSVAACQLVVEELRNSANVGPGEQCLTSCAAGADCTTSPRGVITVRAESLTLFGTPASRVTVTYRTIPALPIPGLLVGPPGITRVVAARVAQ